MFFSPIDSSWYAWHTIGFVVGNCNSNLSSRFNQKVLLLISIVLLYIDENTEQKKFFLGLNFFFFFYLFFLVCFVFAAVVIESGVLRASTDSFHQPEEPAIVSIKTEPTNEANDTRRSRRSTSPTRDIKLSVPPRRRSKTMSRCKF